MWQGFSVGSCTYSDFCKDVIQDLCEINASNCPSELAQFGIDCSCPVDIQAQTIDESFEFEIPGIDVTAPVCPLFFIPVHSLLVNGDFEVKITVNDGSNQHVGCFRFLFSMSKL
jgi:hypothetical protein